MQKKIKYIWVYRLSIIFLGISILLVSVFKHWEEKSWMRIFFSTNDSYVSHTATAIASVFLNADPLDKIHIHILKSELSLENQSKLKELQKLRPEKTVVEFIDIKREMFNSFYLRKVTQESYYRYLIPLLRPYPKALYLDSDIVITGSLKPLWIQNIDDFYAGVVTDLDEDYHVKYSPFNFKRYFNAGVLLLNNEKIRQDKVILKLFEKTEELSKQGQHFGEDQDVLNIVFKDNAFFMDKRFNVPMGGNKLETNHLVLHFIGAGKPWNEELMRNNAEIYWFYRTKTPYPNPNNPTRRWE